MWLFTEQRGKLPQLATDTVVNNCLIILKQWDNWAQKWWFLTNVLLPTISALARNDRTATNKTFEGICLAISGKFLQKELWIPFVFKTIQ